MFARAYVRSVNAWGEPLLLGAFAREGNDRAPGSADFLGELEERVAEDPARYRRDYIEALVYLPEDGRVIGDLLVAVRLLAEPGADSRIARQRKWPIRRSSSPAPPAGSAPRSRGSWQAAGRGSRSLPVAVTGSSAWPRSSRRSEGGFG